MTEVQFDAETGEIIEPAANEVRPPKRKRRRKVDEDKRAAFVRIAEQRFGEVVQRLRILGKMGRNQGAYDYGDADVDVIQTGLLEAIDATLDELRRRGRPIRCKLFG